MLLGGTEPRFGRRFRVGSLVLALATLWALGLQRAGAEEIQPVSVTLKGGELKEIALNLGPDSRPDLVFQASLTPSTEGKQWPQDLQVALVQGRALVQETTVPYSPGGRKVLLRVAANHCAQADSYGKSLQVEALDKTSARFVERSASISIKITVEADPMCGWVKGRATTAAGLVLVLGAYVGLMFANSVFLTPTLLASRLVPLRWPEVGEPVGVNSLRGDVHARVVRELNPTRRARAWLAANPLLFGLPGKRYQETVRISVGRQPDRLRVEIVPKAKAYEHFRMHPEEARGQLFAQAEKGGGLSFFGMPDQQGRISHLDPNKPLRADQLAILSSLRLIESEPPKDRGSRPAGWQILGSGARS